MNNNTSDNKKGVCLSCGAETPSKNVPLCRICFLTELKLHMPTIKFLKADKTETQDPTECVIVSGMGLKKIRLEKQAEATNQ